MSLWACGMGKDHYPLSFGFSPLEFQRCRVKLVANVASVIGFVKS